MWCTYTYWAAPVLVAGCMIAALTVTLRSSPLRVHSYREKAHFYTLTVPLKRTARSAANVPGQYLKSSWSVAESRHQLSVRPVEGKSSQCDDASGHIYRTQHVKMPVMYHLCTEHSLCECVFQSSARSGCVRLWCRLSFQEEDHRSEPLLRFRKYNMWIIYSTDEKEEFDSNFQLANFKKSPNENPPGPERECE